MNDIKRSALDNISYNKKRKEAENEGITTLGEDWDKSLEETIRIAKTPWLDDDND